MAVPGTFLRFSRNEVHPFAVLAIDTPRRRPDDIVFADPEEGEAATFLERNS